MEKVVKKTREYKTPGIALQLCTILRKNLSSFSQ